MKKQFIDLNLDAGESKVALKDGSEESLYALVTSVNIACGGHTGDAESMNLAVAMAERYRLNVGAHPSFPDRENFGRKVIKLERSVLVESLRNQVIQLKRVCDDQKVSLRHLKPHGALYNLAANDLETCGVIIDVVRSLPFSLKVMSLAQSKSIEWLKAAGIEVLAEGFVDRRYENDGTLRARHFDNAMIVDLYEVAAQALKIVQEEKVMSVGKTEISISAQTLCIHGDSSGALRLAKKVREDFAAMSIEVRPF